MSFNDLPPELRLHIFSYVVVFPDHLIAIRRPSVLFSHTSDLSLSLCLQKLGLFTVSQQIRQEALHTFFTHNTFVDRHHALNQVCPHETKWWMRRVRHFHLDVNIYDAENLLSSNALDRAGAMFARRFADLVSLRSLQISITEHSQTRGPMSQCLFVLFRQIQSTANIVIPWDELNGGSQKIKITLNDAQMQTFLRIMRSETWTDGALEEKGMDSANMSSSTMVTLHA
ncbi:hypothetical protein EV356DRAFT_518531 [Viridothelium virens]|uniref:F-box domain-containing protein n=1 Tax=Viridothelium virens TaxID=1048519 RepID=A0A6A6H108_VIRVR|nr:hypothetical protein EV356DRAFT_518531 [Viridothelium virens]